MQFQFTFRCRIAPKFRAKSLAKKLIFRGPNSFLNFASAEWSTSGLHSSSLASCFWISCPTSLSYILCRNAPLSRNCSSMSFAFGRGSESGRNFLPFYVAFCPTCWGVGGAGEGGANPSVVLWPHRNKKPKIMKNSGAGFQARPQTCRSPPAIALALQHHFLISGEIKKSTAKTQGASNLPLSPRSFKNKICAVIEKNGEREAEKLFGRG